MDIEARVRYGVLAAKLAEMIIRQVHYRKFVINKEFEGRFFRKLYSRGRKRLGIVRHVAECADCRAGFRETIRALRKQVYQI